MRQRVPITCGVLLALALAAGGCSEPTLIILEVNGDQRIPDDINLLGISVLSDPDHDDLFDITLNLERVEKLPITVSLEPKDTTPAKLIVNVTAALNSDNVAHSESKFEWYRDKINEVSLPPLVLY